MKLIDLRLIWWVSLSRLIEVTWYQKVGFVQEKQLSVILYGCIHSYLFPSSLDQGLTRLINAKDIVMIIFQ